MPRTLEPSDWLLDLIYDAATEPELWRSVLTEIADRTNSQGSIIFGQSLAAKRVYFDYNGRLNEECNRVYQERHINNPWNVIMMNRPAGPVVMSDEIVPLSSLRKTAFFDEVLRPQDVTHNAMIALAAKDDFCAAFNLCRSEKQGFFSEEERRYLEALVPHLHRSLVLSFRLDGYRALQSLEAAVLDKLTAGIVLFDRKARIIYTNSAARAYGREGGPLRFRNATIAAQSVGLSRQIGELLQNALSGAAGGAMSVPRSDGRLISIVLSSVRSKDVGRFTDSGLHDVAAMALIVDPANRTGVPLNWMMDGFGLTQAEARVAIAIASGLNIPEAAQAIGLSPNTVKTHLRRAFDKTGTARQAELVRLVALMGAVKDDESSPSGND